MLTTRRMIPLVWKRRSRSTPSKLSLWHSNTSSQVRKTSLWSSQVSEDGYLVKSYTKAGEWAKMKPLVNVIDEQWRLQSLQIKQNWIYTSDQGWMKNGNRWLAPSKSLQLEEQFAAEEENSWNWKGLITDITHQQEIRKKLDSVCYLTLESGFP